MVFIVSRIARILHWLLASRNILHTFWCIPTFNHFSCFQGLHILEADPEKHINPMAIVFPQVTKCSFFKYGSSDTLQTHDSICVLSINIMNEKIYVFLVLVRHSGRYHSRLLPLPPCQSGRAVSHQDIRTFPAGESERRWFLSSQKYYLEIFSCAINTEQGMKRYNYKDCVRNLRSRKMIN